MKNVFPQLHYSTCIGYIPKFKQGILIMTGPRHTTKDLMYSYMYIRQPTVICKCAKFYAQLTSITLQSNVHPGYNLMFNVVK